MTERPSLHEVLSELAHEVRPVDLSSRICRTRKRLRRQRIGAGCLALCAVAGAGGFALSRDPMEGSTDQAPGGATTTTAIPGPVAVTASCCLPSGATLLPTTPWPSAFASSSAATAPAATSAAPVAVSSGATARPPSATPPEAVPTGHSCASPWTDESSGNGSPFASSAQREQAATMGTALCGHLGKANVSQLVEWISMRGLNGYADGVTYDIQASAPGTTVYLEVFHRPETSTGSAPVVTTESGALRAQWPDGTVVLMTKGEDTAANRKIVVDPAFDAFRS